MGNLDRMKTAVGQKKLAVQMAIAEAKEEKKEAKRTKQKPQAILSKVVHECGHELPINAYLGTPCRACLNKRGKKHAKKRREATLRDRLPQASNFNVTYDAKEKRWEGSLTILEPSGPVVFNGTAFSVFWLLSSLDEQYRFHLELTGQKKQDKQS